MIDFKDLSQVTVSSFATSAETGTYLLRYGELYFEVNARMAAFISFLQQYDSEEEALSAYQEAHPGSYTTADLKNSLNLLLNKLGAKQSFRKPFIYKRELLSSEVIGWVTPLLKSLFHPVLMVIVSIVALAMDTRFFVWNNALDITMGTMNFYAIVCLLFFLALSSLFHEFGHAAACRYFGIGHGGVGFGLYLNFPVFYTDVSRTWELARRQRCIVNLAGVYFQAYLLIVVLGLYFYTHYELLKYLALVMNIGFAITLNPFFKFDGYWLMTDLTGVPNLRQRSNEALVYLFRRVFRKPVGEKPYLLQIRKRERWALTAYTAVVNVFMGYYFCYVLPYFFIHFIKNFPQQVRELTFDLSQGYGVDFHLVHQMLSQLLFLILTVYFLYKLILPLCQWKRR